MTVKRKSPETTNPNKKQKRISRDEKIEIAISKLEEYEKSVKDTLKMLRDIKRESLRPPPINIPEITATFSSSDEDNTPKYEMVTAPQQLIDAPDGSVISKRIFPDGKEVQCCSGCEFEPRIQTPFSPLVNNITESPTWSKPIEYIDLTDDTPQAHSPCLPNFVGSPRICEEDCDCFDYSGLEGKMKAFYDWRVIPFQALVRGWLVRKKACGYLMRKNKPLSYHVGKMSAYYGCQAIKMQAVVRGGLVRMRLWRAKCEENSKILLRGTIKIQALVRGWLARKPCTKHDLKPVRSGYDHTTYECRNCDYESGCV